MFAEALNNCTLCAANVQTEQMYVKDNINHMAVHWWTVATCVCASMRRSSKAVDCVGMGGAVFGTLNAQPTVPDCFLHRLSVWRACRHAQQSQAFRRLPQGTAPFVLIFEITVYTQALHAG